MDICHHEADVEAPAPLRGLGEWTLEYDALPEIDLDQVDLGVELLGRRLRAPLIVGAMTGGSEQAAQINRRLARAAAQLGLAMALGSQRAMVADSSLAPTYAVRDAAPELPLLFGNIGAVQLNCGVETAALDAALRAVDADALNIHINPLQEAIQPEGDTCFAGLGERIAALVAELDLPCLVKEVGAGISLRTAEKLAPIALAGVEVAGTGGTSWAMVESHRAEAGSLQAQVGRQLAGFGVPTARSILACRRAFGDRLVIASGGIRHGMDAAVALALGADAVAMTRPLLAPARQGTEAVVRALERLIQELRVICFCCGARTVDRLRRRRLLRTSDWSELARTRA